MKILKEHFKKVSGFLRHIKMPHRIKDVFTAFIIGVLISGLYLVCLNCDIASFKKMEYMMLDGMFRLRGQGAVAQDVVIVGIDDTSLEVLGRWPWPRSFHATFVQILNRFAPRCVIFDILFPERDTENDEVFAGIIKSAGNIYLASHFEMGEADGAEKGINSYDEDINYFPHIVRSEKTSRPFLGATAVTTPVDRLFYSAKRVSAINAPLDIDGATRHLPMLIQYAGRLYPTMSLQLACDYLDSPVEDLVIEGGALRIPVEGGDRIIPVNGHGSLLLNFQGPLDTFKLYPFIKILHEYNRMVETGEPSEFLESLKGKMVFIGHMATGTVDARITPFSNIYPAVGGHATALSNILNGDTVREAPVFFNVISIIAVSLFLGSSTRRGRKMAVNLAVMGAIFALFAATSFAVFVFFGIWIHTFTPLATVLVTYIAIAIMHYEAVRYEKKILENELLIAKTIQESFLPKGFPESGTLEFAARCNPAKHVGGDLYDFAALEGDKIGIMIGDVSGKGVPAALYMARAISSFRTTSQTTDDAAKTLYALNDGFAKEGMKKSFITMQYIVAEEKTGKYVFSNGGHNTLLHYIKNTKTIEELDTKSGMPIGIMEGIDYENEDIPFSIGDILFIYTDGISEAMDKRRREFGLERVKKIITSLADRSCQEILDAIYEDIAEFSKGAPQHDDMTAIIIKNIGCK